MAGKAKRVIENPIAYVIKDKAFGEFEVKNSANAWWLDKTKVEELINVCKLDASMLECCYQTGISPAQYDYFCKIHPQFSDIKLRLNNYPILKARKTTVDNLDSITNAQWFLERKRKGEFSLRHEFTGADGMPIELAIEEKERIDKLLKKNENKNKTS